MRPVARRFQLAVLTGTTLGEHMKPIPSITASGSALVTVVGVVLGACGGGGNGGPAAGDHTAAATSQQLTTSLGTSSPLQPWPGYPSIQPVNVLSRWLILKCTFSDDRAARTLPTNLNPAITDLDTYINLAFTASGSGTGNVVDWFHDVSYGALGFEATVAGWYDAPYASNSTLSRLQRVEQCASAVPSTAGIDFSRYDGIIIVTNKPQDGGAAGVGRLPVNINGTIYNLGAVVFDSFGLYPAFTSHEIGHGLGLPHSFDNSTPPVEYGDPFDAMSGLITYEFLMANYPPEALAVGEGAGGSGPGYNLPNLLELNCIPPSRLATYAIGSAVQTFTITALSRPNSSHPLGIKLVNSNQPSDIFTIEYRQADGWDQGIGGNSEHFLPPGSPNMVLIHEYQVGASPFSFLQRHTTPTPGVNSGVWKVGSLWESSIARVSAQVVSIDSTNATATISVFSGNTPTSLAYTGATAGDYRDAVTLSGVLTLSGTSAPVSGQGVTFTIGTQSCAGTTDGAGSASCVVTLNQVPGPYTVNATFAGNGNLQASSSSPPFTIKKEETTLSYTGPTVIPNNVAVTLSGVLLQDGTAAIAGRSVVFTLGTGGAVETCTGVTDATGKASCTINPVNQPLGPGLVSDQFAGDAFYLPSSAQANPIVFAFLDRGAFVLGDHTAGVGSAVTFWSATWSTLNLLSGGAAPASFKGFASTISTELPKCGDTWVTVPGNSSKPPDTIPSYFGVVVSSAVGDSGSIISGNVPRIVVVKTGAGYAPDPGDPGTGTVIGTYCP